MISKMNSITIAIVDGRPKGYITVEELARKTNVDPQCIRVNIQRGKLKPLTIVSGHQKMHWFPENYIFEKHSRGRPKKCALLDEVDIASVFY